MNEFSMFDLNETDSEDSELPDWIEFSGSNSDIAIKMYKLALERREEIINKLKNGIEVKGKEKKIILSSIAISVGKNQDYLNKREFPNISRFIKDTNAQLSFIRATCKTKELKNSQSIQDLKKRIHELESIIHVRNMEDLLSNEILGKIGSIQRERIELKKENENLHIEILDLKRKYKLAKEETIDLYREIKILKQKIKIRSL